MGKWPQPLSTSPVPHSFHVGWDEWRTLSYQLFPQSVQLFQLPVDTHSCLWLFMGERKREKRGGTKAWWPHLLVKSLKDINCHLCVFCKKKKGSTCYEGFVILISWKCWSPVNVFSVSDGRTLGWWGGNISRALCLQNISMKGWTLNCVGETDGCKRDGKMDNYLLSG